MSGRGSKAVLPQTATKPPPVNLDHGAFTMDRRVHKDLLLRPVPVIILMAAAAASPWLKVSAGGDK